MKQYQSISQSVTYVLTTKSLGKSEKFPILTFTMTKEIEEMRLNKPSKEYIQVIAKGIEEAFNLSDDELKKYFNQNFSC